METCPIEFEIDYANESAGWIDCYLTIAGQRYRLSASDVFPPFLSMLRWLRAIHAQRMPHRFYWDEEGKGALFEARPIVEDSPDFHLRIKHNTEDQPWIEADISRQQVITTFFSALKDFALHAGPPSRGDWHLMLADIASFEQFQARLIPPRSDLSRAEPVSFTIDRPENAPSPFQWMALWIWDIPLIEWMLDDFDPFWGIWFDFLDKIADGRLPAKAEYTDTRMIQLLIDLAEEEPGGDSPVCHCGHSIYADPLPDPHLFRLRFLAHGPDEQNFLALDEILDRRQFVGGFCRSFENFLSNSYKLSATEEGQSFDLRSLPLGELKSLLFD